MRLSIDHETRYDFSQAVPYGLQRLRLCPKRGNGQRLLDWSLDIEGGVLELSYEDHHNNSVSLVSLEPGQHSVVLRCRALVETEDKAGIIGQHGGHLPLWFFLGQTPLTRAGREITKLANEAKAASNEDVPRLHALSAIVLDAIRYEKGLTDSQTSGEAATVAGHGVCQDHAHAFIAAARLLGYPARYVSGYLMMDDRVEQEAGHGWAEAHVQGVGWIGFDVSNGICPDPRYVRVATGLDYSQAAPVSGLINGGGTERLDVRLAVAQQSQA